MRLLVFIIFAMCISNAFSQEKASEQAEVDKAEQKEWIEYNKRYMRDLCRRPVMAKATASAKRDGLSINSGSIAAVESDRYNVYHIELSEVYGEPDLIFDIEININTCRVEKVRKYSAATGIESHPAVVNFTRNTHPLGSVLNPVQGNVENTLRVVDQ
jgi:hypothetical protein